MYSIFIAVLYHKSGGTQVEKKKKIEDFPKFCHRNPPHPHPPPTPPPFFNKKSASITHSVLFKLHRKQQADFFSFCRHNVLVSNSTLENEFEAELESSILFYADPAPNKTFI
jgi:hypothetical protein